tara:strand:+ start:112 stop:663 length:552 start_codon:yes stop_codon:yes gene_type:complete
MSTWKISLLKGTLDMIFKHRSLATQYSIYERMVLISLTNLADIRKNNANVFPSINYLATVCGCSRSAIKRALQSLKEKGVVDTISRNGHSNLYVITLPSSEKTTPQSTKSHPPVQTEPHITLPITKTITKEEEYINISRVNSLVSNTQKHLSRTYQQVKEKNNNQRQRERNTKIAYPSWGKRK